MAEEKHFLEIGSDDMPSRALPKYTALDDDKQAHEVSSSAATPYLDGDQISIDDTNAEPAGNASLTNKNVVIGYDQTKAFVGIDYKGDRQESEWRSVGERIGGLIWRLLIFVAIIVWFIVQLFTCERFPIYIINP